nr:hypothetical protein [Tanacetum cinerariifolium]
YARADHLPSPKRIRSFEIATHLEVSLEDRFKPYVPRGTGLEMDVDVVRSDRIEIDLDIRAEIDECITYTVVLRDRWIDARVIVEAVDRDEVGTDVRGPVENHSKKNDLKNSSQPNVSQQDNEYVMSEESSVDERNGKVADSGGI